MGELSKERLLESFGIPPETSRLVRIAQGYINETYAVETPQGRSFVLQQINPSVFPNYEGVMQNLRKVLPYLKAPDYQELEILPSRDGTLFVTDADGKPWRVLRYIQDSYSMDASDRPAIAAEAGRLVGRFHQLVAPANAADFIPVLARFHDLEYRIDTMYTARKAAKSEGLPKANAQGSDNANFQRPHKTNPGRLEKASGAMLLAEELIAIYRSLPLEGMPVRLCHNDTKLSNFLFRIEDDRGLCLIDLDTVMPGVLLYDLGDALRTLVNPLPEDDPDTPEIHTDLAMFRAFLEGLRDSGLKMAPSEKESLTYAAAYMSLLHGIRALTDYFLGDVHYRVRYLDQNLARATNLLGTAQSITENREALESIRRDVFT